MATLPQSNISPAPVPPSKGGCACCAMGCTSMFVIALVGLAMLIGVTWWGFVKLVNEYTSAAPVPVQTETTEAEFASANEKFDALREAARAERSVSMEFTAAEVNALIARHPEFADMRGKFRVEMANSIMTLEMSVPLSGIDIPRVRDRWLNGTARFGLIFHDGNFSFALRSLSANEREVPMNFLESFATAFDEKFNESFDESRRRHGRSDDFWEHVKTIAVMDDKLVITTLGPETGEEEAPALEASPTPASI